MAESFGREVSLSDCVTTIIQPLDDDSQQTINERFEYLNASLFDLFNIDAFMPVLFVYKLENSTNELYSTFVEALKRSLGQVLIPYYPMAGEWMKSNDPVVVRKLHCNDEGVPFVEAASDQELEDVLSLTPEGFKPLFQISGYEALGYDPTRIHQKMDHSLPSLIVQVTRFRCGSVVLAPTFNHTSVDGQGMFDFMQAWSQIAREGRTSIIPNHDRSAAYSLSELYAGFSQEPPAKDDRESTDLENTPLEDLEVPPPETDADSDLGTGFMLNDVVPVMTRLFNIRKEVIERLKQEAVDEDPAGECLTTVDCITALLWRCICRLQATHGNTDVTRAMSAVEGRTKFSSPPLPKHYCGNVIMLAPFPEIPSSLLLSKPHSFAAHIVHSTVRAVSASSILPILTSMTEIMNEHKKQALRFYSFISWHRYSLYDIDFGFGAPVFVAPNLACEWLAMGNTIILPAAPSSGAASSLVVRLEPEAMADLVLDPEFLSLVA